MVTLTGKRGSAHLAKHEFPLASISMSYTQYLLLLISWALLIFLGDSVTNFHFSSCICDHFKRLCKILMAKLAVQQSIIIFAKTNSKTHCLKTF